MQVWIYGRKPGGPTGHFESRAPVFASCVPPLARAFTVRHTFSLLPNRDQVRVRNHYYYGLKNKKQTNHEFDHLIQQ